MARLCVGSTLHCFFEGNSPIKFKVKICFSKRIKEGRVGGKDAIEEKKKLEKILREEFEYKVIKEELNKKGIKFRGMESLAIYLLKRLDEVDRVEISEGEDEEVVIERKDLES